MFYYEHEEQTGQIYCDKVDCENSDVYYRDFYDCIEQAKEDDWRTFNVNGEWMHLCGDCFTEIFIGNEK